MALHAILPGEIFPAVWTGDLVFIVYSVDMAVAVFLVPKASAALRTLFLGRPRFVVDATMFSGRYVLASDALQKWVRLRYLLQSTVLFEDLFALFLCVSVYVCAWEFLRGHLAVVGDGDCDGDCDGSHFFGLVKELSLSNDPVAIDVCAGLVRKRVPGVRDIFLSPGKEKAES
jgi:hypothetical protein